MKVLVLTSNIESASSMYRAFGAFAEIHRVDPDMQATVCQYKDFTFNLINLKGFEVIIFHNPDQDWQVEAIYFCKDYGFKVIVDYDDNFFNIEVTNPYHEEQAAKKVNYAKNVRNALKKADAVIVATHALLDEYYPYNQKITVIRNAFDHYTNQIAGTCNTGKKMVLWRGRNAHKADLDAFEYEITSMINANLDFTFVFWGLDSFPVWLQDLAKKTRNIWQKDPVHAFAFFKELSQIAPALTIVPLDDNEFNKSKSDIAKLEAIAAGSLCLAPNWNEWDWSGNTTFNYNTKAEFLEKANVILDSIRKGDILMADWLHEVDDITKNNLLKHSNAERAAFIRRVAG